MLVADKWNDYIILDAGFGEKVEEWGNIRLRRPDPQIIWPWQGDVGIRENVHGYYHRSQKGGGSWDKKKSMPNLWHISYGSLKFKVEPTGFKHTGLFPEQAVNWDWMISKIKNAGRKINILNLFAYTGGATVACASAGASVCHVDAAKGMVTWAKENASLSGLSDKPIRYIVDDCLKFVEREIRRGNKYDGIVMDPPSYGRGPKGEVWKIEDELFKIMEACAGILSDNPLFFLVNSYTTGFSPIVPANMLKILMSKYKGEVSCGEVGLPIGKGSLVLPCGIFARWEG